MRKESDGRSFTLAPSIHRQVTTEFQSLLSDELIASLSSDAMRFKLAYCKEEFLSKYTDSDPTGADVRRAAAIKKWRSMELRNAKTNIRLILDDDVRFPLDRGRVLSSQDIIRVARLTVLKVLGDTPDLEVLYGTFTSGASTSSRKRPDGVAVKFKVGADVTAPCLKRFVEIYETCDVWKQYRELASTDFRIVPGGILFTVPKNSEIDRCAVKEPDLNMFCQKGVGAFIRKRLKTVLRLDLNDQTKNQKLARIGSADGSLATLDLSSASDLISHGLVVTLLPAPWFELLDDIRSSTVEVDGEQVEVNMFSSMGNAFTFELETLLFWSLANAVAYLTGTRGAISVYGDDIIVPSAIGGLLAKVLFLFGLKVNTKKSFWRGPFRESCGKHWYKGMDVTPFYVKEPIGSVDRLIHFLNRLRAWAVMPEHEDVCDDTFFSFWKKWSNKVPTSLWGGQDLARIDALVTNHRPRMRLVKPKRAKRCDEMGSYLHWLRAAERRTVVLEPLVTSTVIVELNGYRLWRNASNGNVNIPYFPSEWIGYGDLNANAA